MSSNVATYIASYLHYSYSAVAITYRYSYKVVLTGKHACMKELITNR